VTAIVQQKTLCREKKCMSKNYTHSPGCILKVFEADLLSLVKCTRSACLYFNRKCEQKKRVI